MKRTRGKIGRVQGRTTPHKSLAEVRQLLGDEPRSRDMLIEHMLTFFMSESGQSVYVSFDKFIIENMHQ